MIEIEFKTEDLQNIEHVEISFPEIGSLLFDIQAKVKFIGEKNFTVYFQTKKEFNFRCPQPVHMKYVINNVIYQTDTVVTIVKKIDHFTLFTLETPKIANKIGARKCCRIDLHRSCVLVARDANDNCTIFTSNLIDVSESGCLINHLVSVLDYNQTEINPYKFANYNIILFLDKDLVINVLAKCIRREMSEDTYRYAFEFVKVQPSDKVLLSKYIANQQLEQRKMHRK